MTRYATISNLPDSDTSDPSTLVENLIFEVRKEESPLIKPINVSSTSGGTSSTSGKLLGCEREDIYL